MHTDFRSTFQAAITILQLPSQRAVPANSIEKEYHKAQLSALEFRVGTGLFQSSKYALRLVQYFRRLMML
jgi:hypothetical protein